jgi:copper(I)-binding protein
MTDITLARSHGFAAVLALALAQLAAAPAQATDYDVGSIHISNSWARATPKGAVSGAPYMTITNNGKPRIGPVVCRVTRAPNVRSTP